MDRDIFLVGLNHRTATVEVRERFALAQHCEPEQWAVPCKDGIAESLILSTCNRVEILVCGTTHAPERALACWANACGHDISLLRPHIYAHQGLDAVRHVFSVASSLDSMVLGEPQILGQLKNAYRNAVRNKSAGSVINKILHKAFSVAKRVRTETAVASSAVSISYAAVELAKRIFGDMREHSAMLIGAGEMAELAATHLLQAGLRRIVVANRTLARAQTMAQQFNGEAVPFTEMFQRLADVDIVIASTGASEPIIRAKDLHTILRQRKHRPMFFIDIAVPRDIDPDVNSLDNVYLYDIDDLKEVVEENMAGRRDEAVKAHNIVTQEVEAFRQWLTSLDVQPTVVQMLARAEDMASAEIARTLRRLGPEADPATRDAVERMARSLLRKFHHNPIAFLKRGTMSEEGVTPRIALVRRIFRLDHKERGV